MKNHAYSFERVARWAVTTLATYGLSFLAAGEKWPSSLRNYLVLLSIMLAVAMVSVHPTLFRERSRNAHISTSWQRISLGALFLITLLTAAFDVGRLHWSGSGSAWICELGLVSFAFAMTLQIWAMAVNPFFSPEVRIQPSHRLIILGPYRFVRHPGYLAMLVAVPASALAIGSSFALFPAVFFCFAILKRVRTEDAFLKETLAGYSLYAETVPRLVPRIDFCRRSFVIHAKSRG